MADLVTPAAVIADLALTVPVTDPALVACVDAAKAFVARYHDDPAEGADWPADYRLGALRMAGGLYRNANSPGISEAFGGISDTAYRRATDVQVEQLLRIGRFAPPAVG